MFVSSANNVKENIMVEAVILVSKVDQEQTPVGPYMLIMFINRVYHIVLYILFPVG